MGRRSHEPHQSFLGNDADLRAPHARHPGSEHVPFGGMLHNLLRDVRGHLGETEARKTPNAEDPLQPEPLGKLALLRQWGGIMETLMEQTARRGADVPIAIVPRAYRFLDLVEETLQAEIKDGR